jgi:hypothetical protein
MRRIARRVAGKHCCFPAPSERHVTVARHAAQAFTNAPRGTRPLWQRPSRYAPGADGPCASTIGSRTSKHFCCRHICLSPCVGWPRFSRDGRPEGSQPAFAARGCCLPLTGRPTAPSRPTHLRGGLALYPIHYRPAFASSLIPSPLPHQPPLQSAFPRGEATGLLRSSLRSLRGEVVPFGRWCAIRDGGRCSPWT